MKKSRILALLLLLVFSSELWAQGFASIYLDLDELDCYLGLQLQTQEEQRILLQNLEEQLIGSKSELTNSNQTIKDLKSISLVQGEFVNRLQEQLKQAELIRQAQLQYQKKLDLESKLWKAGTITFAVSTLGLLIWNMAQK